MALSRLKIEQGKILAECLNCKKGFWYSIGYERTFFCSENCLKTPREKINNETN